MLEITASRRALAGEAPRHDPGRLREAAAQFESLLIGQLMKSARESATGWCSDGEDQAAATATEMAEEQFARTLARQGGLGLSRMVISGLEASHRSR
jgi:Rod binding domain-containing protein